MVLKPPELNTLEEGLTNFIKVLKDWNHISGLPLSIDELLNSDEEEENTNTTVEISDDNTAIVAEVHQQETVQNGEVTETDSNDEDKAELPVWISAELIVLAEKLEAGHISQVGPDFSTDFLCYIHTFWVKLHCKQMKNVKQIVLLGHGFVKLV